ncbi:hypothetical protein SAY86_022068 [Trapa natans]|uniref:Uncharacterized protein n=1 Tax=Trapa natans TaxID=22666 RepID=A0AAN7MDY1_TRANT|nr:hypothetical protein SAY86_022068 [Trapa natans]
MDMPVADCAIVGFSSRRNKHHNKRMTCMVQLVQDNFAHGNLAKHLKYSKIYAVTRRGEPELQTHKSRPHLCRILRAPAPSLKEMRRTREPSKGSELEDLQVRERHPIPGRD